MRKLAASLLAFCLSGIVSSFVAQQLAVWSGAGEEFILVFFALAAAMMTVSICFFVAQFFGRRAIDRIGLVLMILTVAAVSTLWLLARNPQASREVMIQDISVLAGLSLPILVLIAVHWLTIRLMQRQ